MPLYDFLCDNGHKFERMVKLAHFEDIQFCDCAAPSKRLISTPLFSVDQTGYNCPVTDKWVGSKRAHEENLKQQNCRVLEPGEREATTRRRANEEAAFDRKIEETVEREIEGYSSGKKEQLHNELVNGGLDAVIERR